ncbi:hypothetical protein B296_00035873 [Ensete ventricosum]|uniref:Uncharacterized protein n=1 Tax=Ensete ventricosum TaxID=4639 RepID=A0A427A4L5_ENSVE|nr:hypothetical protein B296_00035873 [Ensete ventricosum]
MTKQRLQLRIQHHPGEDYYYYFRRLGHQRNHPGCGDVGGADGVEHGDVDGGRRTDALVQPLGTSKTWSNGTDVGLAVQANGGTVEPLLQWGTSRTWSIGSWTGSGGGHRQHRRSALLCSFITVRVAFSSFYLRELKGRGGAGP